jgi:hypothetical protein
MQTQRQFCLSSYSLNPVRASPTTTTTTKVLLLLLLLLLLRNSKLLNECMTSITTRHFICPRSYISSIKSFPIPSTCYIHCAVRRPALQPSQHFTAYWTRPTVPARPLHPFGLLDSVNLVERSLPYSIGSVRETCAPGLVGN